MTSPRDPEMVGCEPNVTDLPAPLHCAWCHVVGVRRLAVKSVDGTSVCTQHLPRAIVWYRGKRAGR